MTFYEQELQKIIGRKYPDATYVGRTCYVRLGGLNRAKLDFFTGIEADKYIALRMKILNRREGPVDTLLLYFCDLMGKKMTATPDSGKKVYPYIWDDSGKVDWYGYHPTWLDYKNLSNAVSDYLELFQDMSQSADQVWEQKI